MALTGTESDLAAALNSAISAKMSAATGKAFAEPGFLQAFCEGLAEAIIPHLVDNVEVTVTSNGETAPTVPGQPAAITGLAGEGEII